MPIRTNNQRKGTKGEWFVEGLFDEHPRWLSRPQTRDFGIDLEAELADPVPGGMKLRGRFLTTKVKTRKKLRRAGDYILLYVELFWLNYACVLRVTAILVVFDEKSEDISTLWVLDWPSLHGKNHTLNARATI